MLRCQLLFAFSSHLQTNLKFNFKAFLLEVWFLGNSFLLSFSKILYWWGSLVPGKPHVKKGSFPGGVGVQPLTFLPTGFDRKGTPFLSYTFNWQMVGPLSNTSLEIKRCIPFNCCTSPQVISTSTQNRFWLAGLITILLQFEFPQETALARRAS